ncbi:nuclease A inhibitor family protein [Synechococcus sp. PCC 7502]|uniref:nuclease A inhibitor family protein n=1 Tax=Synechococcus sp. PCC 7502 TaxID=1173263 RepID=UPI001AEFF481|nr:nuclease A inhibitor family protein [Synechococcus sp. PCC 7502]
MEPVPIIELPPVIEPTPEPVVEIILVIDPAPPISVQPEPIPPVIIDSPITPPVPEPLPPVVEPIPVTEPSPPVSILVVEPVPPAPTEHCYCDLDSKLNLADFEKQLTTLTKGLLYPSESDFPIEILSKGFSSKMPPIKGIEVRSLDRVIPNFLRNIDPDDQQSGNVERASLANRWQALYSFIKNNASVTAWHYPVKQKKYTHELIVLLLHPQGTVALKTKLVET